MRWVQIVCAAGGAAVSCMLGAACFDYVDDCELALTCPKGSGSSSSSGMTSGTGGHVNCDPATGSVDAGCGVFVSSSKGDDANDGSLDKPLKTLGAALAKAGAGRVYACGESFTETVTIAAGVTLYGALDCMNGWAYDAGKRTVLTAGAIPLTIASTAMGAEVIDVAVTAADGAMPGGSSIAAVVDHATATFTRCSFVAGKAMDGEPGMSGGMQAMQADPGLEGEAAGMMGSSLGGAGGDNATCNLIGGNGGNGGLVPSGNGGDGAQGDVDMGGAKGTGDTGTGCTDATKGANGMPGTAGPVVPGIGTMDTSGYHGVDGQAGTDGTHGSSGGGGGGSMATVSAHGAGGGGGGAGGCAGLHGTGGKAAGSSVALVSLGASVTLVSCTLGAGNAGNGGAGGDGQFGQQGGSLALGGASGGGASSGCAGGNGGDGGNGGNGSGGLGGHSLGIAATGAPPELDAATKKSIAPGMHGAGGLGGNADADMNHGADGIAAPCWDFGSNAACAM